MSRLKLIVVGMFGLLIACTAVMHAQSVAEELLITRVEGSAPFIPVVPGKVQAVQGDSVVIRPGLPLFLEPNVPNPFNVGTRIAYTLDRETSVLLQIHDAFYNDILTLVDVDVQAPGRYVIEFTPDNRLFSGVYFYSLTTSEGTQMRRMVYVQ